MGPVQEYQVPQRGLHGARYASLHWHRDSENRTTFPGSVGSLQRLGRSSKVAWNKEQSLPFWGACGLVVQEARPLSHPGGKV